MPVALFVAAGNAFGIDGNAMRVAITRMRAHALVEQDERGHYRLGPASGSTMNRVASWRAISGATRTWQGEWLAVHVGAVLKSDRAARRRTDRALAFFSFREFSPGLLFRPDNLSARIDGVRDELLSLGADERFSCFRAGALSARDEARARALWDVDVLLAGYENARRSMTASRRKIERLDEEAAMVESFITGGRVIRRLVLDPLLPDEILSSTHRRRVATDLRQYDQLGRKCWAPLLAAHGVRLKADPGRLGTANGLAAMNHQAATSSTASQN